MLVLEGAVGVVAPAAVVPLPGVAPAQVAALATKVGGAGAKAKHPRAGPLPQQPLRQLSLRQQNLSPK